MDKFRPATFGDARILFNWRNDPLTRSMFRSSDPVEWEDHLNWLMKRLNRAQPHLFIFEIEDGEAIGTFRIDDDGISYTIAPERRRQGFGTRMLRLARETFGPQRAEIFRRNEASIKAANGAGHIVVLID